MKATTLVRGMFLCTISAASAVAQAPPADLQELKTKLQQLEVMMRNLQEQIAAVERIQKAQTRPGSPPPTTTPQLPTAQLPTTYIGQETRQRQTVSDFPEEASRIDNEELVEKSGTDVPFFTQFGVPVPSSLRPDFVAFYRHENKYGHIHAATIFRSVGGFVPNTTIPDLRVHTNGYGASISGAWRLGRRTAADPPDSYHVSNTLQGISSSNVPLSTFSALSTSTRRCGGKMISNGLRPVTKRCKEAGTRRIKFGNRRRTKWCN